MTLASTVDITLPEGVSESQVICRFSVPGEPVPKARARVFYDQRVKRIIAKTPDHVVAAERRIVSYLKVLYPRITPCTEYVVVRVRFYLGGVGRGDGDNYEKLSWDAMQGVVFANDKQVRKHDCELIDNSRQPRSDILVYRLVSRLL